MDGSMESKFHFTSQRINIPKLLDGGPEDVWNFGDLTSTWQENRSSYDRRLTVEVSDANFYLNIENAQICEACIVNEPVALDVNP